MTVFGANISYQAADLLNKKLSHLTSFEAANESIAHSFGIRHFFRSREEYDHLKEIIAITGNVASEPDRAEYGDFQTNLDLAKAVTSFLILKNVNPKVVVEPTCGKGNFIIAALCCFRELDRIIGIEIYLPYIWETKFNIIDFYISNPTQVKPTIEIYHFDVFDFEFRRLITGTENELLILGNPPWVTNSKLSSMESDNVPQKSNFKKHSGFDAITGKGNFDIGEYITLMMFDAFQNTKGHLAFLVKNSVIKNVIFDQHQRKYNLSNFQKLTIDSKREFNVSVEASLLYCKLNSVPEYTCKEFSFYTPEESQRKFGWVQDKFVSNIELYHHSRHIDGACAFEWRQGIKHDLSSVMELERANGHFINGKQQEVTLEEDLIYGVLKSSDLKPRVISESRKFTIVTQRKIGQDTSFIKEKLPKTFEYLYLNKHLFDQRKSSIYNNKPDYSIFGVGEYSFAPYKVAISGLYKTFSFSLILPLKGKPIMLDDTCYLLGFDDLEFAAYTAILLNSEPSKDFLQSITFSDAKRTFTKDILMRIDLHTLALQFPNQALKKEITLLNSNYNLQVSADKWEAYLRVLTSDAVTSQMSLNL